MISTNGITMQFGAKPLFENVSVKFGEGNRYGLIGANGSGKSTFMKILGGDLEQTAGEVAIENGVRLGKLRQDQFAYEDMRVLDVVMMGHTEMWAAMTERDAIYANPEATEDDYMKAAELEAKFAEYDGYTAEARAAELLSGVGISEDLHNATMAEVAPGFKLRVLLAQALFSKPDVLLLDEPTNNLDINTIRWLEGVLNQYDSTMIIISHDRHFLNEVCTHMADLDYNTITIYPGNYDDYMLASAQSRERALKDNAKAKEKLQELQEFVARFSANKSKARQATSRLKQADKIKSEMVEVKPSTRQNPYIRFEADEKAKLHRQAVEVEKLAKRFETQLFKNLNFILEAGQRLAIIGPNGAGKSTLFKMISGKEQPDSGEVKIGQTVKMSLIDQSRAGLQNDKTVFDNIAEGRDILQVGQFEIPARQYLGRFNFKGSDQSKIAGQLSGGERGRLHLAKTLLSGGNVLLLDEPSNDLDVETLRALEDALLEFAGSVMVISHDRWFLDRIATHILACEGDSKWVFFDGNYQEYEADKKRRLGEEGAKPKRIRYKPVTR